MSLKELLRGSLGVMAIDIRLATANDAADVHSIIMDAYSEYQNVPGSSSALDETVAITKTLSAQAPSMPWWDLWTG